MPIVSTGSITITDVNDGVAGPAVSLLSSGQSFTFKNGVATPLSQCLAFTAAYANITGQPVFTVSNGGTLLVDNNLQSATNYMFGIPGMGDGTSCYLDVLQFGSDKQVVLTVTVGQYSATSSILRLETFDTINLVASDVGFTFTDGVLVPSIQSVMLRANYSGTDTITFSTNEGVPLTASYGPQDTLNFFTGVYNSGFADTCYVTSNDLGSLNQLTVFAKAGSIYSSKTLFRINTTTSAAGATRNKVTESESIPWEPQPGDMWKKPSTGEIYTCTSTYVIYDVTTAILRYTVGLPIAEKIDEVIRTQINGRYIGDISNNGSIELMDSVAVNKYMNGISNPTDITYIDSVVIPEISKYYKFTLSSTIGAPTGTKVGDTLAQDVESNASAGNNAYTQVNDPVLGLNNRLRANADNVLGGVISANATSVPVGIRVGNLTWDSSGSNITGDGIAITPKGIYARNAGTTKFVLDATTGDATFSGNLTGANITGATGTFSGLITAGTLGSLANAPINVSTSQSVTVPAGCTACRYELVGGGGGGGGGGTSYTVGYGGGGGAGGYMSGTLTVTPGASVVVVIGTGGTGGTSTNAGTNGTASTLNGTISAAGGTAGGGSSGGAGGMGTGGAAGTSSPAGTSTAGLTAAYIFDGLHTIMDGFGKFDGLAKFDGVGFPKTEVSGKGGSSPLGAGGVSIGTGIGNAGSGYGSGGSGGGGSVVTNANAAGGNGAPGYCVLTFYNPNGVVLQDQLETLKAALTRQGIAVV